MAPLSVFLFNAQTLGRDGDAVRAALAAHVTLAW